MQQNDDKHGGIDKMIQDLHSHTYYSFCGADRPEAVVEAAIEAGVELFGITDHNYGVGLARYDVFVSKSDDLNSSYGGTLKRYFDHINLIKEKYADKINILRGIEIATVNQLKYALPEGVDVSFFDYCLIENLDNPDSITNGDLFAFAKRCGCKCGVAHTDMFGFIKSRGYDPLEYFTRMAEEGIFWEMNVNYDSIHKYRVHQYMLEFFENEEQQDIIRRSGVRISVGFDGHRCREYLGDRVREYCEKLTELGIPLAFE